MSSDQIEFHQSDGWTAVYLNGQLQRVGDSYLADEWLQERVGITVVDDDAFLLGQGTKAGVAPTLDEVHQFTETRQEKVTRAAELRARAADLLTQASELDGK